jgi:SAM-dependent methyltransferase
MNPDPVLYTNPQQLTTLRSVLSAAGFVPEMVLQAIGATDSAAIKESDQLLLMYRTSGGTPLDTLVRLFLIEVPVPVSTLEKAVEPMSVAEWENMGIVTVRDGLVAAKVKVFLYQDMVLVFDLPRRLLTEEGADYVMGVGGSSITLASLTVRLPAARALDLGTGCGFQAFLAAKHCERVIAVDRNPRAISFADLNARLNDFSGVECREGDLFEPVAGMTFDLIVSNPPFVISPESRYIYRDSGMAGDEVCRKIIREAPLYLSEGGFCQILCNWAEYADVDWKQRLKEWCEGSGCDVLVMRNQSKDVATYAATWLRHTEKLEMDNLSELFDQWMAYYRDQAIESVGGGVINMRRRSGGANWFRADDGIETVYGPGGEYVVKLLAAQDFLEGVRDDAALLELPFIVSPDVRLLEQKEPTPAGWVVEVTEVHLSRGLYQKGRIDPYVERLLVGCDGTKPLKNLIAHMASALGVEVERIEPAICAMVRDFVGRGFLRPPEKIAVSRGI